MTTGIYKLFWQQSGKFYVGKSSCIEKRYRQHCASMLRKDHDNWKVQRTYHNEGHPTLEILEVCEFSDLEEREIYHIFNLSALTLGLNISNPCVDSFGAKNDASIYKKFRLIRVWSMLANRYDLTQKQIALKCKVSVGTVADISCFKTHLWLHGLNKEYVQMISARKNIKRIVGPKKGSSSKLKGRKDKPFVIMHNGKEIPCLLPSQFAEQIYKELGISYEVACRSFSRLARGQRKSYRGFTLKET